MLNFSIHKLKENAKLYISTLSESELINLIQTLKHYYYNTQSPLVSDNIYDIIEDYCKDKYPNNLEFQKIGSVIEITRKGKAKLPFYIGSLDKIKPGSGLIEKFNNNYPGQYILSDKLDGQSLLLHYVNYEWKIYTRGNGSIGQDVSHLVNYLKLPELNFDICIRAEFIISTSKFLALFPNAKNARNSISGILTKKSINPILVKEIDIIGTSVIYPVMKPLQQFLKLKSLEFKVATYKIVNTLNEKDLIKYYKERKENSKYAIDGIVITQNELHDNIKSGNPKHSKAFKLDNQGQSNDESAVAVVKNVSWQPSRYGVLKPVVIIEPVNICGVTISKVTGFNYKFIKDNCIGKDSKILIIRSGDVIPHIINIVKKTKPILPNIKYHLSESKIDAIVDKEIDETKIKKINNFFKVLGVESFSIGLVTRFYNNKFNTIQKIIEMSLNDMMTVEGVRERRANIIYNNIHKSLQNISLKKLMSASGSFGKDFGERRIESVLNIEPNILNIKSETLLYNIIINISGFSENLTKRFIDGILKFKIFKENIEDYITIQEDSKEKIINNSNILSEENILITGFRDSKLTELILNNGGKLSRTLSKKVTIVIIKDSKYNNKKIEKAKSLKINIITKERFMYVIKNKHEWTGELWNDVKLNILNNL